MKTAEAFAITLACLVLWLAIQVVQVGEALRKLR